MRITYDPEADAVYIYLIDEAEQVTTQRLTEDVAIDYAPDGRVVGIEVLDASSSIFGAGRDRTVTLRNLTPVSA